MPLDTIIQTALRLLRDDSVEGVRARGRYGLLPACAARDSRFRRRSARSLHPPGARCRRDRDRVSRASLALAIEGGGVSRAAIEIFEQAAAMLRDLGDEQYEGQVMANLALAFRRHGRNSDAQLIDLPVCVCLRVRRAS